ncbi:Protein of unknown function [Lactobacillus helveticus CIRM-BIA 951]|nr:Protein of unknown function [Lactobacillus helveticus CIRM-BIA 951]
MPVIQGRFELLVQNG